MSMSGVLSVTTELSVPWGDMDALGHVNDAVYTRWLEQARIAHFEGVGCSCQDWGSRVSARIEGLACTTPTAS